MSPSHPRLWAAIPAAGSGTRFGADRPKQYARLLGRPMIQWSIEPFLARADIAGVMVAISPADQSWQECRPDSPRLMDTPGGETRADSVLAALTALTGMSGPADWVLVHDAARPCLHPADLDRLISEVRACETGGLLAVAVTDTLKRMQDGMVVSTESRDDLWCALTPQMFPLRVLMQAMRAARAAQVIVTDEAAAMELAGHHPRVVSGRADNIKITRYEELLLATAILTARSGDG